MTVLVTGGAGYIGSHVVKELISHGRDIIVLDDLSRGNEHIVRSVLNVPYVVGDIGDSILISQLLKGLHPINRGKPVTQILHFAAYAYVGESIKNPALYYDNNVVKSLRFINCIIQTSLQTNSRPPAFVFSSTCATYGVPEDGLILETTPQKPINPYGKTKLIIEEAITEYCHRYGLSAVILRYFNAAGAAEDRQIGEIHRPETHLIPLVLTAALNQSSAIDIYGTNYNTFDGTCIRDYVHVSDLADAHIAALDKISRETDAVKYPLVYNLGTGRGHSVLEIVSKAIAITGKQITTRYCEQRQGDPPILVASAKKAFNELGWSPRRSSLENIINTAWNWQQALSS